LDMPEYLDRICVFEESLAGRTLSSFRVALGKAYGLAIDEMLDDLAVAAASNDDGAIGRLSGPPT
jgi:peroxiredoxin